LGQIGGERSSKIIRFEIKRKPENLGRIRVESLISILIKGNNTISWDGILSK